MCLSLSGGSYSRNSAGWYEISWHSHTWPPPEWLPAPSPWSPPAGGRSRSQIARSGYVNTLQSVWMGVSPVHCRVGQKYRSVSLRSVTCLFYYPLQPSLTVHCLFKVFTRFSLDFLSFPRFSTDLLFSTYSFLLTYSFSQQINFFQQIHIPQQIPSPQQIFPNRIIFLNHSLLSTYYFSQHILFSTD